MSIRLVKLSLPAVAFILFTAISCDRNELVKNACGCNDPIHSITWLKTLVNEIDDSPNMEFTGIGLYRYEAKQILLVSWKNIGIEDTPSAAMYDCNGSLLYYCGGNQPFDSCAYILGKSKFIGDILK
jgi:hypothetical protein